MENNTFVIGDHYLVKLKYTLVNSEMGPTGLPKEINDGDWGDRTMKKRSRLRRRVREWLRKRKLRKEEDPIPSFGKHWINHHRDILENPKEYYQTQKIIKE